MTGEIEAAGDIVTGGLVGRAMGSLTDEARGGGGRGLCLNCGTALAGDYCHACGQTGHVHRTIHSLFHDLLHGVFHFEGKIWRTLPMLFTRPGALTRRYIAGERSRFVSPLALFLFSVFLMVATFSSIGGPFGDDAVVGRDGKELTDTDLQNELARKEAQEKRLTAERKAIAAKGLDTKKIDASIADISEEIGGMRTARAITQGDYTQPLAKGKVNTDLPWLDKRANKALRDPQLFVYKLQSTAYKFSWALIPISLPFIWLLFAFRRDVGPYDHAIFAIYSLSAMTLGAIVLSIGAALGLSSAVIGLVFTLGPPIHMYHQLRGAYGLRRFGALWRTVALVISAYVSALLFFIAIVGTVTTG